ncbi:unnamed protein product [Polarella glacialis]|uniref:Protein kinase domain-containing protein n=2 Tax=Polarella glacialis TaxID=89957 RepID=A0A813HEL8_POLGL|nr:unnamed protein product [Polarella glacialis]
MEFERRPSLGHRSRLTACLTIDTSKRKAPARLPLVEEKYTLHEILGQGAIGIVRRATLPGSKEEFAVKTVYTDDPEMVLVSEKEFELLQSLRHPNIVECVELFSDERASRIDMIMPLVRGVPLDTAIKRGGAMAEEVARPLCAQLLRAVHHCHTHRVCHRDIKPENIILVEEGTRRSLVLLDFNIAIRGIALTPTGTRPFMSPEAWQTLPLFNEMTDLWSSGICLYFMLVGFLPWICHNTRCLAVEVSRFPIRLPESLSRQALDLLAGLLCRNVARRYLVSGALAHPWLRLARQELKDLFGVSHSGSVFPPQPAYRDWEVRARKSLVDGDSDIFGHRLESSGGGLPKTVSWPSMHGEYSPPSAKASASRGGYPAEASFDLGGTDSWDLCSASNHRWAGEQLFYSDLPVNRPLELAKFRASAHVRCWEVRLRRGSLVDLYGRADPVPPYRNWETLARRKLVLARGWQ